MGGVRILVTGGAGFIGSHLVDALLARGDEVVVLDNFLTGKRENLAAHAGDPAFTLIEGDIRDFDTCRRAVAGCDAVLHEAALGSVPRSMADPQLTLEINIQGFINVIEAARQAGVKRFVFASSSSVYGDDIHVPKQEEFTGRALSPYAYSKQSDETTSEIYGRIFGVPTVGLRYFNVFGARQDPGSAYAAVIPKFAAALLQHRRPVINGDGSFSRDFTYIDNVVRANLLALTTPAVHQIFNIACGERTTLNELFLALRAALAGFDPTVAAIEAEYGPERPGDVPHSLASIEKARRQLGYEPECLAGEGLRRAAKWYFEHLR